jgi:hypothetical protein
MATELSFGVEFEFNFARLRREDQADPHPEPRPVKFFKHPWDLIEIKNALESAGLPTRFADDQAPEELWSQGYWVVGRDHSIHPPDEFYDWASIEVQSPPYLFTPNSLNAIKLACSVLTSNFRTNINQSCGLHVHIGNSNKGFAFQTVKNLMAFLWCFEPQLSSLHPASRDNGAYTRGLRKSSYLARTYFWAHKREIPLMRALTDICKMSHINDLYRQLHVTVIDQDSLETQRMMAYNLHNLARPYESPIKRTVEFRQHEGTLDSARVIAWIATVAGLVDFATAADIGRLEDLLTAQAELQDSGGLSYSVTELFRAIGLTESATYYEQHLAQPTDASNAASYFAPAEPFMPLAGTELRPERGRRGNNSPNA